MKRHGSMNHIFRLVWCDATQTWVPVAETMRGRSKRSRRTLIAAALALATTAAHTAPTGGQLVTGAGTIAQVGNTTTIFQTSQSLSLNWSGFNIAPQETVVFRQPAANSIAVNRILDANGTIILGHLDANGKVFLINPNGILFGRGAQANVGGLVASALSIETAGVPADEATRERFQAGGSTGSVINQGTITASPGGYVALLADHVGNQGVISARLGTVVLAAGNAATLTFSGNSLVGVQVDHSLLNTLAANGGLIQADGGRVAMTAGARNALLASAVNNTGVIEARTVDNHEGTITLLGGMNVGTVEVAGTLDASAPAGGNGGSVETSAANVKISDGAKVTTAAALGLTGTWLIDPHDFTVAVSGGDESGTTLSAALGSNNVTLQSSAGTAVGSGNVNIDDIVTWSANTLLTLTASNNVNVNRTITATGATAGIAINANTPNGAEAASGSGGFLLATGAAVNLPNVSPTSATALNIGGVPYTVINSLGADGSTTSADLQGISGNLAGHYALGSNIDATATSTWVAGFTPLGSGTSSGGSPVYPFTGGFDGLGHGISNLTINSASVLNLNGVGLFGLTGNTSTIRNVALTAVNVDSAQSYNVGALVGINYGAVSNSYSTGTVPVPAQQPDHYVGGLIGTNFGTVSDSHSTAAVSLTTTSVAVGGLVGNNDGTISNSYWNITTSNQTTSNGGTGLTSTQMLQQASFVGFDFTNSWLIYDGVTYPLLLSGLTPLTVTANAATATFNGSAYSGGAGVTYSVTPNANLLGTLTYTGTSQGAITPNTYSIAPGGLYSYSQQGYIITYASSTLTIAPLALTGTITTGSSVYGAALTPGTPLFSNLVPGYDVASTVAINGALSSSGHMDAGTYTQSVIALSGANAGDYSIGSVAGTYTVGKLPLTGTIVGGSSAYGAPLAPGAAMFTNVSGGDLVVGGVAVNTAGNLSGAGVLKVGTFSGSESVSGLSGADSGNYTVGAVTGSYTVSPLAISVAATGANKIYDGTRSDVVTLAASGVLGGDQVTFADASASFATKDVGTAKAVTVSGITLNGADAANYTLDGAGSAATTANITPATLTVTGESAASKVYDGSTAATLTGGSLVGVAAGDAAGLTLADAGAFASSGVRNGAAVVAADVLNGAAAGNYVLVQPAGLSASITPATLTYDATPATRTSDQTLGGWSGTVTGFVANDSLNNATTGALVWSSAAGPASPPGRYAIDGGGLSAANYVFVQDPGNVTALTLQPNKAIARTSKPDTPPMTVVNVIAGLDSNITGSISPITLAQWDADPADILSIDGGVGGDRRSHKLVRVIDGGVMLPENVVNVND